MLKGAPDAICASPYGLGSDRVRTPSTANALPGSRPEGRSAWTLGSCLLLGSKQESCARRANHGAPVSSALPAGTNALIHRSSATPRSLPDRC